jgi:hypothetical protein
MEVVGEGGTVVGIDSNQSMVSERELSVSM